MSTESSFEVLPDGVRWRGDGETVLVQAWGPDAVRVRATCAGDVLDTDFALLPQQPTSGVTTLEGQSAIVAHGRIRAVLKAATEFDGHVGRVVHRLDIEFRDDAGRLLLRELDRGGSLKQRARRFTPLTGSGHRVTASFEASPGEKLYGMGQYQQDLLDIKGSTFELAHRNSQVSIPFVLSSAGYGFLWHNPAIGRATFAVNRSEWVAESAAQLDYWITAAGSPAAVSAAYADVTGHAPVMPEYGLGFWQCKLRYWNQEQLLEVAREHTRRGLPLDVIVADFFHWPKMGDFRFEEEFWPDPKAMVAELHELGVELMVSVWPQAAWDSENFERFSRENLLVRTDRGIDVQMGFGGPSVFLDLTDPRTRQTLWDLCRTNYHRHGIRAFWLDEAEPEFGTYDYDNYTYHAGPVLQVGNLYPQAFSRAFYEGQTAAGQTDIVNLVRCAWAGSQRYGALVWSGDIHSTWTDLRRQLVAGIQMGVAGIPWFTTDIGGFYDGVGDDPAFRELLVRWFQFATFCPVMRLHGDRLPAERVVDAAGVERCHSGASNELWSYGDDVYAILSHYVHLRERLRAYSRAVMLEAHESGQPAMRGMFHEFPEDPVCWDLADQFMYGADLLVAPVMEPGAVEREVYLPAGAQWTEVRSGQVFPGGRRVTAKAPIDVIPVFARDGRQADLLPPGR